MSDPVTTGEIEDVLASIRRLVVEGAQAPLQSEATVSQERLVLTAALRVVEPRAPLSGIAVSPAPVADVIPMPEAEAETPVGLEAGWGEAADRAGRLEAAMTTRPEEWEPDGSEPVPVLDWSRASPEDAPVFRSRHGAPLRLGQPVADAATAAEEPAFRHTRRDGSVTDPDGLAAFAEGAAEDEELRAFLARATLDEEMLRRIVTQVLQQELQGALGERITRNVRKLVRREINRALTDDQDI
jgi:hypothetical protein